MPRLGERTDDVGLAGAGWPDEGLDLGAGGEDPGHRGGLVLAELHPGLAQLGKEGADVFAVRDGCASFDRRIAQRLLGGQVPSGGVAATTRYLVG